MANVLNYLCAAMRQTSFDFSDECFLVAYLSAVNTNQAVVTRCCRSRRGLRCRWRYCWSTRWGSSIMNLATFDLVNFLYSMCRIDIHNFDQYHIIWARNIE